MTRQIQPVFIVGTGRCGSTMLSNMLRRHRDVLSISEFLVAVTDLGSRIAHAFPETPVNAAQVWSVLGSCHPKSAVMLRHGIEMDEFLYRPAPPSRFSRESGVPAVLLTTLPHLTAEPDALFDELREFVMTLDSARAVVQYRRVFEWLERRFRKRVWVERSGGSLRAVPRLAQSLPDARFVHIVRDGRDCAISMSRHTGFRMMMAATMMTMILGYDPFDCDNRAGTEDLPGYLYRLLPEHFDVDTFHNMDAPPALFGLHWSGEIKRGLHALAELPRERVLTLRFEDILADPAPCLRELIGFIDPELVDEEWVRRSAAMVRPVRSSWQKLPPQEQAALVGVCSPGLAALAEFDLNRQAIEGAFVTKAGPSWRGAPIPAMASA
ncbi:MAG TPA: sulfotransferase [Terriglobia bacterium]|nr:sulfotransferase [Terriglobia bacterium]